MFRRVASIALLIASLGPAMADTPRARSAPTLVQDAGPAVRIAAFADTLRMGEVIDVMRTEGLKYGDELEAQLFPEQGGDRWAGIVSSIYDPQAMRQRFDAVFVAELARNPAALPAMAAFFGDARGQRILGLEIEARRALMDEATEEAAKVATAEMMAGDDPRVQVLRDFAEANDLIEMNVSGALNANLAFFQGMAEGGAFGAEMTEEQMLTDVWSQEAEIRAETEDWLYPFLSLAYQPLEDAEMEAYLSFSRSAEGRLLNGALFAAFDAVFSDISRDLGRAAARLMQGQDI